MKRDSSKQTLILCLFGLIPVIWGALLVAPSISGGIPGIIQGFPVAIEAPLHIEWCEDSLRAVLFLGIFGTKTGITPGMRNVLCCEPQRKGARL